MESVNDLIARIRHLDETLVWEQGKESGSANLISIHSLRVIAGVQLNADGQYQVFEWQYERRNLGCIFKTLDAAENYAKFDAIKDILQEDLRRQTVQ